MELVVARHLLNELAAALVLEDDEVADQVQEPALVEDASQQHLQLQHRAVGQSPRPSIVRQGMNHSLSAVSEPIRASRPSETTSSAL